MGINWAGFLIVLFPLTWRQNSSPASCCYQIPKWHRCPHRSCLDHVCMCFSPWTAALLLWAAERRQWGLQLCLQTLSMAPDGWPHWHCSSMAWSELFKSSFSCILESGALFPGSHKGSSVIFNYFFPQQPLSVLPASRVQAGSMCNNVTSFLLPIATACSVVLNPSTLILVPEACNVTSFPGCCSFPVPFGPLTSEVNCCHAQLTLCYLPSWNLWHPVPWYFVLFLWK